MRLTDLYDALLTRLREAGLTGCAEDRIPARTRYPFVSCRVNPPLTHQDTGSVVLTGWLREDARHEAQLLMADALLGIIPESGLLLSLTDGTAAVFREEGQAVTWPRQAGAAGVCIRFGLRIIDSAEAESLLLGEGVLLRGVDLDAAMTAASPCTVLAEAMEDPARLLGAVREGCVFRCVPEMIDLTHGQRTPAVSETLAARWEVSLAGTLLAMSRENAALLLNLPQTADAAITPEAVVPRGESVCWVGASGNGLMVIELQNPINLCGMKLQIGRGLGETPFLLAARKADPTSTALPCRLFWLKEASA